MADVRPLIALRYSPNVDLASAICPPYDVISPEQQRALHRRSPHNAVRLELAEGNGDRYLRAAQTLRLWLDEGVLRRDDSPTFYVYRQEFQHSGRSHRRRILFSRLRLEEWERDIVLPHEGTLDAAKEDRLRLLRATRLNSSPVLLIYRDQGGRIGPLLDQAQGQRPIADFRDPEGQTHTLWRLDDPDALTRAFDAEKLYVADGHHRYETALAFRDERRAQTGARPGAACEAPWTGSEPENFALAALTAADDPGLLVLPIHRLAGAGVPLKQALSRLARLFEVEVLPSPAALLSALSQRSGEVCAFGLAAAESPDLYLLTLSAPESAAHLLPQERSAPWRGLDAAIATYAVLGSSLGLTDAQMSDTCTLEYTEDAEEALRAVRGGDARYALLLNPVPVRRIMAVADAGDRMPPKSTFFYPKVPTGLVFNPLDD